MPLLIWKTPLLGTNVMLNPAPVPFFTLNCAEMSSSLFLRVYTPGYRRMMLLNVYSCPELMNVPRSVMYGTFSSVCGFVLETT